MADDWDAQTDGNGQNDDAAALREKAKMFEAILRANPVRMEAQRPDPLSTWKGDTVDPAEAAAQDVKDAREPKVIKPREILFRGNVYTFKPIGPQSEGAPRAGVIERWRSDIHLDDGAGFNVVVDEFRDGRFTPWSFDGIFFDNFMQAAIVGVMSGSFQASWHREHLKHEQTRQKFILFVLPAVFVIALAVGIVVGLRHG